MSQYFDNDEKVKSSIKEIKFDFLGHSLTFLSDNGVFSKSKVDDGSLLLMKAVSSLPLDGKVLDLGSGYGVVGITLAVLFPNIEVTFADVNRRALELAITNSQRLNVFNRSNIVESDVYNNLNDRYNYIISNPPIRAGKKVTYRIYSEAKEHLIDGGSLIIVIRKQQGAESVRKYLESIFSNVSELAHGKGYHVYRASDRTNL